MSSIHTVSSVVYTQHSYEYKLVLIREHSAYPLADAGDYNTGSYKQCIEQQQQYSICYEMIVAWYIYSHMVQRIPDEMP